MTRATQHNQGFSFTRLGLFLFDPAPTEGGNGPAPPSPLAPAQPIPGPPPGVQTMQISIGEYQAWQKMQADHQAAQAAAAEQARIANEKAAAALIEKGKTEEGLNSFRQQATQRETSLIAERDRYRNRLHEKETTFALQSAIDKACVDVVGMPPSPKLLPGASDMVQRLLRDSFEIQENPDGTYSIREKGTGRSIDEAVKAKLAEPSFAFFLAPSTQGGTGAGRGLGGPPPVGPNGTQPTGPAGSFEAEVQRMAAWAQKNGLNLPNRY